MGECGTCDRKRASNAAAVARRRAEEAAELAAQFPAPASDSFEDEPWRGRAACRTSDPEDWFPVSTSGARVRTVVLARRYCAGCPVLRDCAHDAMANRDAEGIRAGVLLSSGSPYRPSAAALGGLRSVVETGLIPGQVAGR